MTIIRQADLISSIADCLQQINCVHPSDFIKAMTGAYERETAPAARDALAQILTNSRMCAENRRPICQDTGIVTVFARVGMDVRWDGATLSVSEMIHEGVRLAYRNPQNPLRASILADPAGSRVNTRDNTPAVIHFEIVPGNTLEIDIAAKGGGSEAQVKFAMLPPSASIIDWVMKTVPTMGAGWCPPGIIGIGIGGTPEKAMLLARESLMEPVDMPDLLVRGATGRIEEWRVDLYKKINALGIGAQGLGGDTTVLDVKIREFPTHAATLPIALIPSCAATRHARFTLDGSGPARFDKPVPADNPTITWAPSPSARRVDLNSLHKSQVAAWRPGESLLLSGRILTGRDAAHKRLIDLLTCGEKLPVDLANRIIYYVGPVDPVGDEVIGPAGPTTAKRMDIFTRPLLEKTGLLGMIGKGERSASAIAAIKDHQAVYLTAVGGAAYLLATTIKSSRVIAFADLGMEAIYEFEVEDMPVTVAIDSHGATIHATSLQNG